MKKIILILVFVFVAGCSTIPIENSTFEMKNGVIVKCPSGELTYGDGAAHFYNDGIYIEMRYRDIKKMEINR